MRVFERIRVIVLFLLIVLAMSCGTQKKSTYVEIQKDKIEYALPGQTQISLKTLCDNLEKIRYKNVSGQVKTEVVYIESEPILEIKYDTVWKEKEVIRFKDREVEVVRNVMDYKWTWWALVIGFVAGMLIMWLKPWKGIMQRLLP